MRQTRTKGVDASRPLECHSEEHRDEDCTNERHRCRRSGRPAPLWAGPTTRTRLRQQDVTVQFAMPQPQPAPAAGVPGSPDNASTHFLLPDDVTIRERRDASRSSSTAVVTGSRFIEVSKKTTRDDIAADLCQGLPDRRGRSKSVEMSVCNGTIREPGDVDGTTICSTAPRTWTYRITDGKGDLVIDVPGFNIDAANSAPRRHRVDSPARLLTTSGRSTGSWRRPARRPRDCQRSGGELPPIRAGAFLTGSGDRNSDGHAAGGGSRRKPDPASTFNRTGRYLVICMNRAHPAERSHVRVRQRRATATTTTSNPLRLKS